MGVWKRIRKGWEGFSKFVKYEVEDGSTVQLWYDLWCGEQPLKFFYPKLFSIARFNDVWVADHVQFRNENIHWNILYKTRA